MSEATADTTVDRGAARPWWWRRGWRFWAKLTLVAVLTLYGAWRVVLWVGIAQELSAIHDAGEPTSFAEVVDAMGAPPALEDDAAEAYRRALEEFDDAYSDAFQELLPFYDLDSGTFTRLEPLPDEVVAAMRQHVDDHAGARRWMRSLP